MPVFIVVAFGIAMYYVNKTDALAIKDFIMSLLNLGVLGFIAVVLVIVIVTSIKNTK